jgi:hypothetical protein
MTDRIWNSLKSAMASVNDPPAWLAELAGLSKEEVLRLPNFEDAADGQLTAPWIEEKIVAADYLDFLREQIRIDARGPDWKELLQQRLRALEPFVGKTVLTATFHQKPYAVVLKINPETGELFHCETY